ncbi:hypothetical protein JCM33774_55490 [Actinophytocola sp. KF-1]
MSRCEAPVRGRCRGVPSITVAPSGSVYRSVLQCVAQIDEPPTEAAFVGYRNLFSSPGVGVEHA